MCIPEITNQKNKKYKLNMCIAAETIDFHMKILLFCKQVYLIDLRADLLNLLASQQQQETIPFFISQGFGGGARNRNHAHAENVRSAHYGVIRIALAHVHMCVQTCMHTCMTAFALTRMCKSKGCH